MPASRTGHVLRASAKPLAFLFAGVGFSLWSLCWACQSLLCRLMPSAFLGPKHCSLQLAVEGEMGLQSSWRLETAGGPLPGRAFTVTNELEGGYDWVATSVSGPLDGCGQPSSEDLSVVLIDNGRHFVARVPRSAFPETAHWGEYVLRIREMRLSVEFRACADRGQLSFDTGEPSWRLKPAVVLVDGVPFVEDQERDEVPLSFLLIAAGSVA